MDGAEVLLQAGDQLPLLSRCGHGLGNVGLQLCAAPCSQRKTCPSEGAWWDRWCLFPSSASPTTNSVSGSPGSRSSWYVVVGVLSTFHCPKDHHWSRQQGQGHSWRSQELSMLLVGAGTQVRDLGEVGPSWLCRDQPGEPGQPPSLSRPHFASVHRDKEVECNEHQVFPGPGSMTRGGSGVAVVGKSTGGAVGWWWGTGFLQTQQGEGE